MTPKVSIIIPVYNTPTEYLKVCLDSVCNQSLKDLEILVIDNGSQEETIQILQDYEKKDPRLTLVRQKVNGGVANSRNTGAKLAQGEYLYFMDSDDILEKDASSILYHKSKEEKLEVLLFRAWYVYENEQTDQGAPPKKVPLFEYPTSVETLSSGQDIFKILVSQGWKDGYIWTQFLERDSFQKRNLSFSTEVSTCDDQLFTFENLHTAKRVSCIQEFFYQYRVRENSGTTQKIEPGYVQGAVQWYLRALLQFAQWKIKKCPVYQQYFSQTRAVVLHSYWLCYQINPLPVKETLLNAEHLIFGETLETLAEPWFLDVWDKKTPLIFFGAGIEGGRCLSLFQTQNLPLPVAFCDNDARKQGTLFCQIPVLSWEDVLKKQKEFLVLITNQRFYPEIYQQVSEDVGEETILSLPFWGE